MKKGGRSIENVRYKLRKNSLSDRIYRFIEETGPADLKDLVIAFPDAKEKSLSSKLGELYKRGFLDRMAFPTRYGKIHFLPNQELEAWKKGLRDGLIPKEVIVLQKFIKEQGAVSTLELEKIGVDPLRFEWFRQKFVRQSRLLKLYYKDGIEIFYKDKSSLERYISNKWSILKKIQARKLRRVKHMGMEFERIIEKYYRNLGFQTVRNKFFTTPFNEKIEIDILVTMPEIDLIIVVECKNFKSGLKCFTPTSFLSLYPRIKQIWPGAIIHIWSYGISNYLIKNRSFWRQYRDVKIFSSKQIKEVIKKFGGNLKKKV